MKPSSCKAKGSLQQRVAADIKNAFDDLEDDDVYSTPMGAPGEDVRLSPKARDRIPLSIECKCVEKINVWACLQQAEANCPSGANPCLVFSRNRASIYAVVPWNLLLDLFASTRNVRSESIPPRLGELLRELAEYADNGLERHEPVGVCTDALEITEDASDATV